MQSLSWMRTNGDGIKQAKQCVDVICMLIPKVSCEDKGKGAGGDGISHHRGTTHLRRCHLLASSAKFGLGLNKTPKLPKMRAMSKAVSKQMVVSRQAGGA